MMASTTGWCSLPPVGVLAADEYRKGAAGKHWVSSSHGELVRGLSCLRRKMPEQFLGEGGAAMCSPYPTGMKRNASC